MKIKKISYIVICLVCLFLSLDYSCSYFKTNTLLRSSFKTKSYNYKVDLDGGTLNDTPYVSSGNFVISSPIKNGSKFLKWEVNNNSYKAIYTSDLFSVNINSNIQGTTYENGLAGFTYNVYLNDELVAQNVSKYSNDAVTSGSKLRVVVNKRDGYSITSDVDKTYDINSNLDLTVSWFDDIAPTINDLKFEIVSYSYNSSNPSKSTWKIRVTIDGYDNGVGIRTYSQYKVLTNTTNKAIYYMQSYTYSNITKLSSGVKWCGTIKDDASNETTLCKTYYGN